MKKRLLLLVAAMMFILASCGSKPSLSKWVNGKDVAEVEKQFNDTYTAYDMTVDFSADGEDILVMSIIYGPDTWKESLEALDKETIDNYFTGQLDTLSSAITPMFDACKDELGIELSAIRVAFVLENETLWSHDITP